MTKKDFIHKIRSMIIIMVLVIPSILIIFPLNPSIPQASAESVWEQTTDKDFFNGTSVNITIFDKGEAAELGVDIRSKDLGEKTYIQSSYRRPVSCNGIGLGDR